MNKVCPSCNSVNRSTAFYCHACGSRLLTTIPPAVALEGEQNLPGSPPEAPKASHTTAEIGLNSESDDADDDEIYDENQKAQENQGNQVNQENQKAEAKQASTSSESVDVKAEVNVSDIPTAELTSELLTTEEEEETDLSTGELQTLYAQQETVMLSPADKAESSPELPLPTANHKKTTPSEAATDELKPSSTVVSFKKKTTNSLPERQTTTVLALAPEFESKDTGAEQASKVEALSALPPGTLIAKRFETIELLESDGQTNLYAVYDRAVCPSCGSTENKLEDNYCWECGFDLSRKHELVSCQLREALLNEQLDEYDGERFVDDQRFYLRLEEDTTFADPPTTQPVLSAPEVQNISLSVGYQSHTGMVRQLNEDSLSVFLLTGLYESLSKPTLGLFIVADGMGGHASGEIASKFITQTITERLVRRVLLERFNEDGSPRLEAIKPRVEEAIRYGNEQLYHLAQERHSDMGSTVTLALVVDHRVYIANVGDSRVYIHRHGQLQQITKDHSVVASLIAAGMAQPNEIYTHPERNVVYRSMGYRPSVELDIWEEELKKGDKLLLCSDGLWEAIRNEGIEEVLLTYTDAQAASEEMVRRANLAGGEDNITVILVQVG